MKKQEKTLCTLYLLILLVGSCIDFFDIAWGTGVWLGEIAFTWAILFFVFCIFCSSLFYFLMRIIWQDRVMENVSNWIIPVRRKLSWARWILVVIFLGFPVCFFQFTPFGIIFHGFYLCLSVWTIQLLFLVLLLTFDESSLLDFRVFMSVLIITATIFSISLSLNNVTNFPFSLGWSEGNRLWDYSILFGRERYDFPPNQEIDVLLDPGRQLVGGLPFLFPNLTIKMERMWIGLISVLPYFFLGMVAFRFFANEKAKWFILILWTYLFLKQGPIHPPLVFCAILVMLAWRNKSWLSILLIILATYAAYISRYTWTFAPAIWFFMLECIDGLNTDGNSLYLKPRIRFFLSSFLYFALCGLILFGLGVYFKLNWTLQIYEVLSTSKISPAYVIKEIQEQPLLWYRLFPNTTYGKGILLGLLLAICPLIFVLWYLVKSKIWQINTVQKWFLVLPVLAFFIVGMVVSVKIGGGGDLHNMDMFLISLFMLTVIALHSGARGWLQNFQTQSYWVNLALTLLIVIPGIGPLRQIRSYNFYDSASWLVALTDARNEKSLDMYPPKAVVDKSIGLIQSEVDLAKMYGDVLFMDQRQLLTFRFIQDVPLIPEYDKKALIEQSLAGNLTYFEEFYDNLEKRRFTLIITQPLNTPQKGSDSQFGEENDAWVKWVAIPLLCYYEAKQTLSEVNVQLLIPKQDVVDCAKLLP